ncbi:ABC transporter permease [Pseudomonas sp. C5pp]|uniref:ABC transporter permease n=1 Tax=Pseudomonas sp. C5pp TaxID=1586081 RepID=UPI00057E3B92|nr:ABC transporter permease [Pseudomonas sp. C5pp]KIC79635.1 hypothetical protein RR51_25735 [Pseudomonas sp. C5pp]
MTQIENLAPAQAFELALALMRQKRWVEAATLWQAFREQYKGHATPWLQGAICCFKQEQYEQAGELLEFSRHRFDKHVSTWLISADWAQVQGEAALEAQLLGQGRAVLGDRWELLCRTAALAMRNGDVTAAKAHNLTARNVASDQVEPLIQAAEIAEKLEQWEEVAEYWNAVVALKPAHPQAYQKLSQAYERAGQHALARRYRLAMQYGAEILNAPVSAVKDEVKKAKGTTSSVMHFANLVVTKAILNLKSESSRTHLNYAWVVLEPLLHLVIYYFLFGRVLNAGVENYGLFLLCGLVPWMWFTKAVSTSATSILGGQSLMLNSNVQPAFFPLVNIVQSTFKQLPAMLLLIVLRFVADDDSLSLSLIYFPLIVVLQFLLTIVLGMLLAALVSIVRDIANIVGTGLTLLMILSGVIYNYQSLPGRVAEWVQYNPLAVIIAAYRQVILQGASPEIKGLLYVFAVSLALGAVNYVIYKLQRKKFVRRGMA